MGVSNCPAGLGWQASFLRFQVGGAPGLAATEIAEKYNGSTATANLWKRKTLFFT